MNLIELKKNAAAIGIDPDVLAELLEADPKAVRKLLTELAKDNLPLWVLINDIKVDHKDFNFDRHRYLLDIYACDAQIIVVQKAAQMGLTIWMLLKTLQKLLTKPALKFGFYMPTSDAVGNLSKDRLSPLILENDQLKEMVDKDSFNDTIGLKQLGTSSLYLFHIGGIATKDSVPLDGLAFDEVRLMKPSDIDQTKERIEHSEYKYQYYISTCGLPRCFDGDTEVIVKEKSTGKVLPKTIRELVDCYGDFYALSLKRINGSGITWRNIECATNSGVKQVVKVNFHDGSSIICTPDHPFLQIDYNDKGGYQKWTKIEDVHRYPKHHGGVHGYDEGVITVRDVRDLEGGVWNGTVYEAPYDLLTCYVIGVVIAEGSYIHKSKMLIVWQKDKNRLYKRVVKWAKRQGLPITISVDSKDIFNLYINLKRRNDLQKLFLQVNDPTIKNPRNLRGKQKNIPDTILGGSVQQLEQVMLGLVDGDGQWNEKQYSTITNEEIGIVFHYHTVSDKLRAQFRFVCRRLGMPVSGDTRPPRKKGHQPCHRLSYNPNSFFNREEDVSDVLSCLAVKSIEYLDKRDVYDLQIEGPQPAFVLAENGAIVHNTTINARFLRGTQLMWHSKCLCGDEPEDWCCLPLHWPDCVVDIGDETYYICPKCNARINAPQNGAYVAHNPDGEYPSFHISQLISDYITPKEVWDAWLQTDNISEFWNAKLGLPYIDEANRPMNHEIFQRAVNEAIPWSWTKSELGQIGMGVDQRSGQNHVIIAQRVGDKKRIIHVELIDGRSPDHLEWNDKTKQMEPVTPFKRLHHLMEVFEVDCCVCDGLPNANEAQDFGRAFPDKVFLAYYANQRDQMRWSDKQKTGRKSKSRMGESAAISRVHEDSKFKWHVILDRYISIEVALRVWQNGHIEIGDPRKLTQIMRDRTGRFTTGLICDELLRHLMGVIRVKYNVKEDGTYAMQWENTGLDPHFLHAWNYCFAALERVHSTFTFDFAG